MKFLLVLSFVLLASTVEATILDSWTPLLGLLNHTVFSRLRDELVENNITSVINVTDPMTIFAPTNDAFASLEKQGRWDKNVSREMKRKMLTRLFVINRKILPTDFKNDMIVQAVSGEKLRLNVYSRARTVNGVIAVKEPRAETHDVIVYRLNRFLMAPADGQNLIETLSRNRNRFSTLINVIETAGLSDTLKKGGPYTLFAPNNDAFKAIPEAKLNKLLEASQLADLKTILLGHVINGTYFWPSFLHSPDLHTLDGGSRSIKTVAINANGNHHMEVSGARILIWESMIAENGVVYTINRVLLPSDGIHD